MNVHRIAGLTQNGSGGHPAGVVLANTLPDASEMQALAAEVGYSETAFAALPIDQAAERLFPAAKIRQVANGQDSADQTGKPARLALFEAQQN